MRRISGWQMIAISELFRSFSTFSCRMKEKKWKWIRKQNAKRFARTVLSNQIIIRVNV